ncbi:MAG: DNA-binding domain-containing protein [Burkholderiales bacterium]
MSEARRQRDLLAALATGAPSVAALRESGERAARGLEAYRANAESIADRALASAFATVQAMVGGEDFKHLAREFWRAHPPERGDLGEWGDAFPAWLAAHAGLTAWPWLADSARLDLALHRSERAADAVFDADSLGLLESTDPAQLQLVWMPGTALLCSAWPIAMIHRAHQLPGEAAERAFADVREAVAAQRGERVLVARQGWRALVHPLDAATAAWTQDLLDGIDLATALTRAGDGFDFAAWLGTALRESWLKGVAASND